MPEGAWEQGFASRIIMVYSGDRSLSDIFTHNQTDPKQQVGYNNLLHDLHSIYALYGEMKLTDECIEAFRAWHLASGPPIPTHPKLVHYCSRRTSHTIKLAMVASAARGNDMIITLADFELARNWLLGAELTMPDVFKAGVIGADSKAMEECWHFVWSNWSKDKKPLPEYRVVQFVSARIAAHSVMHVINLMERDGTLKKKINIKDGKVYYEPGPRRAEL
jgi:hypothetical protein